MSTPDLPPSLGENNDLGGLLGAMSQLQSQLQRAESDTNARRVTGSAAGGQVTIEVTGEYQFQRVHIDPSLLDPADPTLLEDLLVVALRDATKQLKTIRMQSMGGVVAEAMGGLFGGLSGEEPHGAL
jgi:DNA-binding YbaB/EbfC family protein